MHDGGIAAVNRANLGCSSSSIGSDRAAIGA